MEEKYFEIRKVFKNGDWVFGIGKEEGCSQCFDFETEHPQPFSYLGGINPNDFRIATKEEIANAQNKTELEIVVEMLLSDLVNNSGPIKKAPKKIDLFDDWYEINVGIGRDHTAKILIDSDALSELCKRNDLKVNKEV